METIIIKFEGNHAFLSNFHKNPVQLDNEIYPTAEHAYQCQKTDNKALRKSLMDIKEPGRVKAKARRIPLKEGWNDMRLQVMYDVVKAKFQNEKMAELLLDTGHCTLIEGNTHGDIFWGMTFEDDGVLRGENHLGRILMKIRDELRKGASSAKD